MTNFKKIGVAAAVAAALGASGAAQAVQLGVPGEALLIPYVLADSANQVNSLIGVTVTRLNGVDNAAAVTTLYSTLTPGAAGAPAAPEQHDGCVPVNNVKQRLHWYFFTNKSVHVADGGLNITCEDFVRFDWANQAKGALGLDGKPLDGQLGYIVIASEADRGLVGGAAAPGKMALYGASYLIQGNWASEAYIPVVPLNAAEVTYGPGGGLAIPTQVNPLAAGMPLAPFIAAPGPSTTASFSLRYFLDPALGGSTRFVLWFPDNVPGAADTVCTTSNAQRCGVPIEVYDADEGHRSAGLNLPYELNVIDAATQVSYVSATPFGVGDGHDSTLIDAAPDPAQAVKTGFVRFDISDGIWPVASGAIPALLDRAGIAFSLVGIGTDANKTQLQTELAHERGVHP